MGTNPTGTPAPIDSADLSQVISFMAEDKSNDWSDEIRTLESVETELTASRARLAKLDSAFENLEGEETALKYAKLGRYVAALLGSHEEWDIEFPEHMAAEWKNVGGKHSLGDQNAAALKHWRALADRLSIEHDGEEDEICREEGCENSLNDGEGYDGLCGEHADQAEEAGEWDGE